MSRVSTFFYLYVGMRKRMAANDTSVSVFGGLITDWTKGPKKTGALVIITYPSICLVYLNELRNEKRMVTLLNTEVIDGFSSNLSGRLTV